MDTFFYYFLRLKTTFHVQKKFIFLLSKIIFFVCLCYFYYFFRLKAIFFKLIFECKTCKFRKKLQLLCLDNFSLKHNSIQVFKTNRYSFIFICRNAQSVRCHLQSRLISSLNNFRISQTIRSLLFSANSTINSFFLSF